MNDGTGGKECELRTFFFFDDCFLKKLEKTAWVRVLINSQQLSKLLKVHGL